MNIFALAALALAAQPAQAKPVGTYDLIAPGLGDELDPSIDSQYIVFQVRQAGRADWDIDLYEIGPGNISTIAGGPGDQEQPDVNRTTVAYRSPKGIVVANWELGMPIVDPDPAATPTPGWRCLPTSPVASPTLSASVAAWECGAAGARTIVVARYATTLDQYELVGTDLFGPSADGDWVTFVEARDGSTWLHDASPAARGTSLVAGGRATGAAVFNGGAPLVAIARQSTGPDADIEIWDPTGALGTVGLVTALVVPGEQRNPHLSGEWVAFEDVSTGHSQVVLWQWTTGLVFVPHPMTSNQTLNDLGVVANTEVRVVYADDGDGTDQVHSIALYRLAYVNGAIPDDGMPITLPWTPPPLPPTGERPPPASCGDLDAGLVTVIGTLALGRDYGAPDAGATRFWATPWGSDEVLPVVVCVDALHASAGWLTLDDEAIATPRDFNPSVQRLELHGVVERGRGIIAGVIAGKPGASLLVRVLPDPGRIGSAGDHAGNGGTTGGAGSTGGSPSGSSSSVTDGGGHLRGAGGCGTAGTGPLAALALLLAAFRRRR